MIACYLALKIKKCRDELHCQEEFKWHGLNAVCLFCTILGTDYLFDEGQIELAIVVRMGCFTVMFILFCYISTKWLINKFHARQKRSELVMQNSNEAEMKDTLEKIGFNLFAMHLITEHSVQHLLFVLEVSKLKAQCLRHGFISKRDAGRYLEAEDILKRVDSEVFDAESFYRNAQHIMEKYIDWEGEYSVNISAFVRNKVLEAFDELCERRAKVIRQRKEAMLNSVTIHPLTTGGTINIAAVEMRTEMHEKQKAMELDGDRYNIKARMAVIDVGMQDVWHLLENDSFARFRCSKEFHRHQMNCMAIQSSNMPWIHGRVNNQNTSN